MTLNATQEDLENKIPARRFSDMTATPERAACTVGRYASE